MRWLQYSTIYHLPHVMYYDSIPELIDLLLDLSTKEGQRRLQVRAQLPW
jgi:hypothetical protein